MAVINLLSPHVADMIAAGEVVERPASVIKELIENSFDAGAKNITVEIRGGGATYIRVTDDGCGMAPEDAGVAFLRHATSKLRDESGLEAISTMGFRGEALAAISAVSKIELKTRLRGAAEGTRVTLEAGDIENMTACGCPEGTSMTVRDIFYNTPARLKFLKSDRAEAAACQAAALRCALGRPEVSLRFIRDGEEEFFSPGDGREDSAVYTLLGRELAASLLEVKCEEDGIGVRGFVSSPAAGRGSRAMQFFFCNGRYIKSALLQSAVEQAYKNTLLTGRYPACALWLDISCSSVDVNVHPAKTEVKFSYEKKVFDLVYHASLLALGAEGRTVERDAPKAVPPAAKAPVALSSSAPAVSASPSPRADFYRSMSAADFRENGYSVKAAKPAAGVMRSSEIPYQTRMEFPSAPVSPSFAPKSVDTTGFMPDINRAYVEKPVQNVESSPAFDHKIVGEAMKTYIIVERGEELIFIDKHAAHERMIFDRLKEQKREIMSQRLLTPVTLSLDGAAAETLEKNAALLAALGFEIEPFGENAFILRAVPYDMAPEEAAPAVEEICEKLGASKPLSPEDARDEILHTVACKAAIKAGWDTDARELERVAEAVLSGRVRYCPHGRPVSFTMTRRDLDKAFKRIV